MSEKRIPLDPQPPDGVEVVLLTRPHGGTEERYYNHAMTVGLGYDTMFFHCPSEVFVGVQKRNGIWEWIVPAMPWEMPKC